jgi:hypothetical protein
MGQWGSHLFEYSVRYPPPTYETKLPNKTGGIEQTMAMVSDIPPPQRYKGNKTN